MENHRQRETIKCPKCGHIQRAEVLETAIWNNYVHHCEKCEYVIMESEWETVILGSEFYEVTP